jgi:hypothetical protein
MSWTFLLKVWPLFRCSCMAAFGCSLRHRYDTVEKARAVLVKFGLAPELIDRQLRTLSKVPPSFLLRFPEAEITDEVLRSLEFTAAAFQAPKLSAKG